MSTTTTTPACTQPGCTGHVVDGYCDVCGMPGSVAAESGSAAATGACQQPGCSGTIVDGYCDVCGTPGEGGIQSGVQSGVSVQASAGGDDGEDDGSGLPPAVQQVISSSVPDGTPCAQPGCKGKILDGYCDTCGASGDSEPLEAMGPAGVSSSPSTMSRASNRLASTALGSARAGVAGQHQDPPGALGVAAAADRAARRAA